jgi:hypothetical protein
MEMESYKYPEEKPDRNPDEQPVKDNDHALDALRYFSLDTGDKRSTWIDDPTLDY